ncbi:MAG: T9SS type A sorting domain-containing protein [Flavobacteriales bacterium]
MNKIFTLLLTATVVYNANAGKRIENGLIIGTASQVHQTIHNNPNQLNINGEILNTNVLNLNSSSVSGTIKGYEGSQFAIKTNEKNEISGFILLSKANDIAYKYITNANSNVELKKVSVHEILCVDYHLDQSAGSKIKQKVNQTSVLGGGAVPIYNSLSSSDKILFLDFDGYNLPSGSGWNNGTAMSASASNYTDTEIFQTWSIIAEDYSAFNVNVTTDSALYDKAPLNKKIRMVFTNTSAWYPNAGGVAYVDVFDFADTRYKTGWVFVDRMFGAQNAGEAGAHEAGHTFGLNHDGTVAHDAVQAAGYYSGHSNWAPIMGSAYGKAISHFSKGEYTYADNTSQDDLAIIASVAGYKSDDHGNTYQTASDLGINISNNIGTIDSAKSLGLIHDRNDLDFFHFYTSGGNVSLTIAPTSTIKTNLDVEVKIYDGDNVLITTINTAHNANTKNGVSYNANLAAGDYYISIDGAGSGDPTTGWNDYCSIGQFYVKGTISYQDDFGNDDDHSTAISYNASGNDGIINALISKGILNDKNDIDVFDFYTYGGTMNITVTQVSAYIQSLNLKAVLCDSDGVVITSKVVSSNTLNFTNTLAEGKYYIRIMMDVPSGATLPLAQLIGIQFNISGTIENVSFTTNIVALSAENTLQVYPNPLHNSSHIYLNRMVNSVKLLDSTGKLIAQDSNCNKMQVNSDLSSGVYFLQIVSGNETSSIKIIR